MSIIINTLISIAITGIGCYILYRILSKRNIQIVEHTDRVIEALKVTTQIQNLMNEQIIDLGNRMNTICSFADEIDDVSTSDGSPAKHFKK